MTEGSCSICLNGRSDCTCRLGELKVPDWCKTNTEYIEYLMALKYSGIEKRTLALGLSYGGPYEESLEDCKALVTRKGDYVFIGPERLLYRKLSPSRRKWVEEQLESKSEFIKDKK